jgi:SAM-dependent methyltransferase
LEILERRGRTRYWRCPDCGFLFLDPRHRPGAIEAKQRYLLHTNGESSAGYRNYLEKFAHACIAPFADPGLPVLDFGSGPNPKPVLPLLLAGLGYACDIYDPLFVPTRRWRQRSYGCIILHEVAEHLADPKKTLASLAKRLAPGGILAIRTRFPPQEEDSFSVWWYRMDPTHVSFYSPESLRGFLGNRGFGLVAHIEPDCLVFKST